MNEVGFWLCLAIITAVGLYTVYEFRYGGRDVHEGNVTSVKLSAWSVWLSGVLLFVLGGVLGGGIPIKDGGEWVLAGTALLIFAFACVAALPSTKHKD